MQEPASPFENALDRNLSQSLVVRKPAVETEGGLVTAQNRIAAQVGAEVLRAGGNAVDAAVAVSFALGVVEPWMSGPGGGGVMLVYDAKRNRASVIDFAMRAPRGLDPNDFPLSGGLAGDLFGWLAVAEDRNLLGGKSIAVPGQPAGLAQAHDLFATMPWEVLLQPAIALAEEGPVIDWFGSLLTSAHAAGLSNFAASRSTFLSAGWVPFSGIDPAQPSRLDFSQMAKSLRLLASQGAVAFYEGPLAKSICADVQNVGGYLSEEDLRCYRARQKSPLTFSTPAARFHLSPGLTAGETFRRCYELWPEARRCGDGAPDQAFYTSFVTSMSKAYAERLSQMGDREEPESCTSHFNVVDSEGNLVAVTQTLLSLFGSKVMLPESGFLMNNGIMWFDPDPGGPNSLGPGKTCLMNVCPTLVDLSDGRLALGASGGRKIVGAVAQLAALVADRGLTLEDAFHQPRVDVSGPDGVVADDNLPDRVLASLAGKKRLVPARRSFLMSHFANACGIRVKGRMREGMTEPFALQADSLAANKR
jgi:gamma-glutamyltranspeptidase/glutathione hydrolase